MTDPNLRSWVESANNPETDFPIQNLPYGTFKPDSAAEPRIGVAIGDQILDLRRCREAGLLSSLPSDTIEACSTPNLNSLMSLGRQKWWALRAHITGLLSSEPSSDVQRALTPMREAQMLLPAAIGDYTDFYASVYHATNVGALFRPDNPLLPNYKYVPIGYHGRASSIVVSGTQIRRPCGQIKPPSAVDPIFAPSASLDYELEVGFFIGPGNALGQPIPIDAAESHIFGLCLLNDWSARDIQSWEYQPLGPFLAKSFVTSISPWIVTLEALQPFRTSAFHRPSGDPNPLPYLQSPAQMNSGGIDLHLEVEFSSAQMRDKCIAPVRVSHSNLRYLYWTIGQMTTHHASNGCNLRPGDLLGTGTVSGSSNDSRGCLLEITRRGAEPLTLPTGEKRSFLLDGDEIVLRGYCEKHGFPRIGLGECRGIITPADPC